MSDSLQPHELQHARPPYPSQTPGVYPNSCPLSWWCHPNILSSVVPFSSFPQSFPPSGSFHESALHIRWPKYWSFSSSVSPSKDRMWSTGEGNGKPLQYSCHEDPVNSMCPYRQNQLRIKGVFLFFLLVIFTFEDWEQNSGHSVEATWSLNP